MDVLSICILVGLVAVGVFTARMACGLFLIACGFIAALVLVGIFLVGLGI